LDRAQKEEQVASLNDIFVGAGVLVVAKNEGLSVSEFTDLRRKVRHSGGSIKVAKNRLVKIALQGTKYDQISDLFVGPTTIAYSDDVISAPKTLADFAKTNEKLVIVGGAMGDTRLDVAGVKALANLPSFDELRAKLISLINTPATRIVGVTNGAGSQLARIIAAYSSK
tara:strand:+ start:271 stop:777 length:507 start_codon:yes stop_codon:yes gene_type:complete